MPDQNDSSVLSPMAGRPGFDPSMPKPAPWAAAWHKPIYILFLAGYAAAVATLLLRINPDSEWQWLNGFFWLLAAATSIANLARRLPFQNVITLAVVIGSVSWVIHLLGAKTGIPFGPVEYTDSLGVKILDSVPWALPFIWMVALVNGRGVARLIMRPWRKTTYYGFWVIGLTAALVIIFDVALEPYATQSQHFWLWRKSLRIATWYSAPWVNFLGWAVTAVGILGFATPWLINKQPVKQATDYHPLILWLLLNGFLLLSCVLMAQWAAVGTVLALNATATFFAIRGARW